MIVIVPDQRPTLDYATARPRFRRAVRYEWLLSIPLVLVTWLVFKTHFPQGPVDTIGFSMAVLFAWLMTLNSFLVRRHMHSSERRLLFAWFALLTILTFVVLADAFTTRGWSSR